MHLVMVMMIRWGRMSNSLSLSTGIPHGVLFGWRIFLVRFLQGKLGSIPSILRKGCDP